VSFGEPFDQSAVASVRSGQSDLVEELGGAEVEGTEAFPTGLLGKGTGEEGFAHSCRTRDEKILVTADPLTGGETEDEGFFDSSRGSVVEILQGGLKFEFGVLEEAFETFVFLPDPSAIPMSFIA
jgi:hypothetical protein